MNTKKFSSCLDKWLELEKADIKIWEYTMESQIMQHTHNYG